MKHYLYALGLIGFASLTQAQNDWEVLTSTYTDITLRDVYADGETIIAVGSDIGTFTPIILSSFDDGSTWDTSHVNTPGPLLRSIAFSSPNKGIITSVNTQSCALRTEDKGRTWKWHFCDLDSSFTGVNQVYFLNDKIGYMAGWGNKPFEDGVVYKTTDGGNTWSHVSGNLPNRPFEYLQFLDENNGYGGSSLFGHSNLYRTKDGGKTWTDLPVKDLSFGHTYFHSIEKGTMVCSNGKIMKTTDAGLSWTEVDKINDVIFMSVDYLNPEVAFAIGSNTNFESKIYISIDSGNTWTEQAKGISSSPIDKVRFFNGRAYAVGGDGVVMRSKVLDENTSVIPKSDRYGTLNVYPNPSNGVAHIDLQHQIAYPANLVLIDTYGRIVLETVIENTTDNNTINTAQVNSGLYHIKLTDANNIGYNTPLIIITE